MDDGVRRLIARYHFIGGGSVEIVVMGDVATSDALDMAEEFIKLKRAELQKHTSPNLITEKDQNHE